MIPETFQTTLGVARTLTDNQLLAMGWEWDRQGPGPTILELQPMMREIPGSLGVGGWADLFAEAAMALVTLRFGSDWGKSPQRTAIKAIAVSIQSAGWAALLFAADAITTDQYVELCRPWHAAWTSEGRVQKGAA